MQRTPSIHEQKVMFMGLALFLALGATQYFATSELESTDKQSNADKQNEAERQSDQNGWVDLFNGKDLTGWKANRKEKSFRVENGVIRAQATDGPSHLFYVGDSPEGEYIRYKDFELEIVARSEPNSNSGVFFHTDWKLKENGLTLYSGYEAQLNNTKRDPKKTGGLYAIVDLDKSPVDETQWFKLNLKVQGKRIVVKVDGETVVDYTEEENPKRPEKRKGRVLKPEGGAIALQAHDKDSVYYFKSVRIKDLRFVPDAARK